MTQTGIALVHNFGKDSNRIPEYTGPILNINHTLPGLVRELKIPDGMKGYRHKKHEQAGQPAAGVPPLSFRSTVIK